MDTIDSNSNNPADNSEVANDKPSTVISKSFFGEPAPLNPDQQDRILYIKVLKRRMAVIICSIAVLALAFGYWYNLRTHAQSVGLDPMVLEQTARDNPHDLEAQLAWAEVLVKAKRVEDASPVLEQAKRIAPNDSRVYALLGIAAVSGHRDSEARDLLNESLKRNPSDISALRTLANLDAQQHHLAPAIKGFERLTQINPKDADAWQRLGLLLIGARENYRSYDALSHAAALAPNDILTQRAFGNMALHAGRLPEAKKALQAVLALDPNDQEALTGLGGVLMQTDPSPSGLASAETYTTTALQSAPSAIAYRIRGQIRMMQRNFPGAIEDLNFSVRLEPEHRSTYVYLSQCYARAGKPDLAKKATAIYEKLTEEGLAKDRTAALRPVSKK